MKNGAKTSKNNSNTAPIEIRNKMIQTGVLLTLKRPYKAGIERRMNEKQIMRYINGELAVGYILRYSDICIRSKGRIAVSDINVAIDSKRAFLKVLFFPHCPNIFPIISGHIMHSTMTL